MLAKSAHAATVVSPRHRELAILGLSSVLDVPYIAYCHRDLAARVGIMMEQYEEGWTGKVHKGLSEGEVMAYRLGCILGTLTGPIDDKTWDEALSVMNKSEIFGVHTL
jgi:4-carboxymuconolactone decarboxylase